MGLALWERSGSAVEALWKRCVNAVGGDLGMRPESQESGIGRFGEKGGGMQDAVRALRERCGCAVGELLERCGSAVGAPGERRESTVGALCERGGSAVGASWERCGSAVGALWERCGSTVGAL